MQPERWNQIKDLFQTIVDEPPEARAGLLDRIREPVPALTASVQ